MKSTDRFLLAIVAGILALAAIVLIVALLRPSPAYQPDDTPSGVVHNYLLAVQQRDYPRAYGYLATDLARYPRSPAEFAQELQRLPLYDYNRDSDVSLSIQSVELYGDKATVTVEETDFYDDWSLFATGFYASDFQVELKRQGDAWKIVRSTEYWDSCWDRPNSRWCRD